MSLNLPTVKNLKFLNIPDTIDNRKSYLVELFSTWCPHSLEQVPHISKLAKQYKDALNIIAITREDVPTVKVAIKNIPLLDTYNIAVDSKGATNNLTKFLGADKVPHAFLFDNDGSRSLVWHGHPSMLDGVLSSRYTLPI